MNRNPSTSFRTRGFAPIAIILAVVGILVVAGGVWWWQKTKVSTPAATNSNTQPINQNSTPTPSTPNNQVYETQYMKVNVPAGWTLTEVTRTIQNQTYDKTTGKTTLVGAPVVQKTGAVNITKGNYILFINPRASQASGVEGGRFVEIAGGAPSADTVIIEQPGGPCGLSDTNTITVNGISAKRIDYYINSSDTDGNCRKPTNGETVWYFSYITNSSGSYFNYYNIPNYSQASGWVVTMAYNSKVINSFPIKNSVELNQSLMQMSDILETLTIKAPVPYNPDVSQAIKNISNTYWSSLFYEGANGPIVSCTDTANTSSINQFNDVQTSLHMESIGPNANNMYTSADTQVLIETIAGIFRSAGWSKCNSLTKYSPPGANLQTTDIIDVYQKDRELVNIDANSFKGVNGGMYYDIFLTFYKLK